MTIMWIICLCLSTSFFFWVAIATWSLTFFGMIRQLVGGGPFALSGRPKNGRGSSDQQASAGRVEQSDDK